MTSVVMAVYPNGSFEALYDAGGGPNKQTGTFAPEDLPEDSTITFTVLTFLGPTAPTSGGVSYLVRFSALTATTVDVEMDLYRDGFAGPYLMKRQ